MLTTLALAAVIGGCPQDPDGAARLRKHELVTLGPTSGAKATRSGTLVTTYTLEAEGLKGTETTSWDLSTGRFASSYGYGLVTGGSGFDGETAWTRDLAGYTSNQRGGDKRALAINEAYRAANLWWRTDRGGARVESVDCETLRVTPRDGKPFDATFSASGELLKLREARSWNTVTLTQFSEWRDSEAGHLAGRIEAVTNDDAGTRELRTLRSAAVKPAQTVRAFARPANAAAPKLPGGRVSLPFRLLNNHVVVDVRVNGTAARPFIVDTGGHEIITPGTAVAIGLRAEGNAVSGGAGEKTVTSGYARVASLDAGAATMRDAVALVLDFSPADVEGLELGGMLGVGFMERYVVEFDYGAHTLTFIEPAAFDAASRARAGTLLPLQFYDHMPQVEGSFEGIAARFNLDTGSRSDVTLTAPFVARAALRERFPDGLTVTDGWGVGGPARSYVVRGTRMSFGSVDVGRPIAGLSVAKAGVMADENFEGNVGSGLLKRFVVTFDYPGERLYLRRLEKPDADTGRFDRTGLWINAAHGGVEVMDVAKDGPGAAAGLATGDVITAIGAHDVAKMPLSDVRRLLKLLPDAPVRVKYQRKGQAGEVTLVPRALIPD